MPSITVGSYPIPRRGVYTVSNIATVPISGYSNRISFAVDCWTRFDALLEGPRGPLGVVSTLELVIPIFHGYEPVIDHGPQFFPTVHVGLGHGMAPGHSRDRPMLN